MPSRRGEVIPRAAHAAMRIEFAHQRLKPLSPLVPGQGAQVFAPQDQNVIEADEGRVIGKHFAAYVLAAQPLLQRASLLRGESRGILGIRLVFAVEQQGQ